MRSKDATELEAIELRGQRTWTLEVPVKILNEREIVARGTRPIDPPIRLSRKVDWKDVLFLSCGCLVVIGAYLALEFGWLDFLKPLFI